MASYLDKAKDMTGIGSGGGSGVGGQIIWMIVLIVIFAVVSGVVTYFIVIRTQFKYKVVIWERINGQFQVSRKVKAKKIGVGKGGDEILLLSGRRGKMLPMPTIQSGKNTYYYFVSDDGEWINFSPGDFDVDRREMGATFLDKEMRYARTQLQFMAKERYDAPNFWQKYGGLVAYTVLILVTAIGFFLIIDKLLKVTGSVKGSVEAAEAVIQQTKQLVSSLDNVCSGGRGYV